MDTHLGTDVRDSPVRAGPVASTSMKGAKLSWKMKRGGQSGDTFDSHGTGPILEFLLPDTIIDRETRGMDASTPILRPNYRARPRQFRQYWTLIPDAPPSLSPTPRTQPGPGLVGPQQATQLTGPLAIIAQLQSNVHMLKMASPVKLNPVTRTQPVRHQSVKFTNTDVPKFRGNTCWDQHRQVFDASVKLNGWDDDTVALQLLAHL